MRLPHFPLEALELDNFDLGVQVLAWFVAVRAEDLGMSPEDITEEFSEATRKNFLKLESNRAEDAALEKALLNAASGDYVKAGQFMREILFAGAKSRKREDYYLREQKRLSVARSTGGRVKAKNVKQKQASRDEKIIRDYKDQVKSGRIEREVPGILAQKYDLSASRIRQICRGKSKNK